MANIPQTNRVSAAINGAVEICKEFGHEFIMPEHLLLSLLDDFSFSKTLNIFYSQERFREEIEEYLSTVPTICNENMIMDSLDQLDNVDNIYTPTDIEDFQETDYTPEISIQMTHVIELSLLQVQQSSAIAIDITHIVKGILQLEESWAAYILKNALQGKDSSFLSYLVDNVELSDDLQNNFEHKLEESQWRKLVVCMNDLCHERHPLIGREEELQRTIQVLCRMHKNNPLHIGESGVGKTALVWGLAQQIEHGNVPQALKNSKIYQLEVGTLIAGTQYRGDFEKRIKLIMDGITEENNNNIIYIDEIHTLVGAGATGESALDASNMLKPYLEQGNIKFIGSTTHEEYNRYFSRSKGMMRRFQQIDIPEPSIEETKNILTQLCSRYEKFHGVKYSEDIISFAVEASAKYINDRFLPDKAIDLIDEAGAYMQTINKGGMVSKSLITDILSKMCKVTSLSDEKIDETQILETLYARMLTQIYGQDQAVLKVVQAIQMAKAGLLDDGKPLSSLLFVGPTGVGKTEIAKVLAKELGIELLRFDMSEYAEKHMVAKLIGAPAGYVGYDDGGLLTDAIRKTPHCVLLLDEIEKAHEDIYNILLQVMDYARLTDNKGRHADFRNVILILTSNAGAQQAAQTLVGFTGSVSRSETMMKQVKKIFKPEFINRLSSVVLFHEMDRHMARLILEKKIRELDSKLQAKHVDLTLTPDALEYLLSKGFTTEYGAREIDRVISQELKPLLMNEILFGTLKHGGDITIDEKDAHLSIR